MRIDMLFVCALIILLSTELAKGRHLNIAVVHLPPDAMIEVNSSGNVTFNGPFIRIVDWLSDRLHFTYTLTSLEDTANECKACSSNVDPIGKFVRRADLDMLLPQFGMTHARYSVIDYTSCTTKPDSAFVLPAAELESFLWAPVKPFTISVWIIILTSGLFTALAMSLTRKSKDWKGRQLDFQEESLHVFAVLVNQGDSNFYNTKKRRGAFRFIGAVWCGLSIVLVNAYSGNLISYMMKPTFKHHPQHETELVKENFPLDYTVLDNSLGVEIMKVARSGTLKVLADRLKAKPKLIVPDRQTAFQNVASGCCAYNDLLPYIESFAYEDYKVTGRCRISLGRVTRGFVNAAIVLHKNSPHTRTVSLALMDLTESGLILQWGRLYARKSACLVKKAPVPGRRTLRMNDMSFPFLLLVFGSGISLVVYLIELFLGLRRNCSFLNN